MEHLSLVIFVVLWLAIGKVVSDRFALMFNFAMHKNYPSVTPSIEHIDDPFIMRLTATLLGPAMLIIFPLALVGLNIEWSWRAFFCKPGQVYFKCTGYPEYKTIEVK